MQVLLESPGIVLPSNEAKVLATRVGHAFERLARRIDRVHVSLRDVNGPRGGCDKLCMIRIELATRGQIVVREKSSEMNRALKRALSRARTLVSCELKRRSWPGRRPLLLLPLEARQ